MTPPRYNTPGQTCFVTVRAVGRAFRFLPDRAVRESIDFLFALCVAKYGLLVHEYLFLSNHFHMVVTDPAGALSDFLRDFDSMLSRQLNALRGTKGTNFEKEPRIQIIADAQCILDKSVYSLTNPLAAHLVERMRQWKGCSSFTLVRPAVRPELSDAELRRHVRDRVAAREQELIAERRRKKIGVLGWRGVVTQHYTATPRTSRVLFERRPRVTGSDRAACARVLATLDRFVAAYRCALASFQRGASWPTLPYGTLQLARRYGVRCATAPP